MMISIGRYLVFITWKWRGFSIGIFQPYAPLFKYYRLGLIEIRRNLTVVSWRERIEMLEKAIEYAWKEEAARKKSRQP